MPTTNHRLLGLVGAACLGWTSLAFGQAVPAAKLAVPPVEMTDPVKLSEFTVSTDRDLGYYSSDTSAGSVLTGKPVKELALAVTLINRDLLDDLQTTNIAEAMQFSASFNPENGLVRGQGAQMNAEGQFTNRVGNSTNGVPDSGAVERIELIKGPPSVLMSSASAGGAVNITPKRPQRRNFSELEYQFGNYQQRYRVEANRVLTPKLGARLGIQYSDADFNAASVLNQSNIPEFDGDMRLLIFGSVEWRPFPNTVLGVDVEQVRDRATPSNRTSLRFATVTRDGQSVRIPWYLAYGVPLNWSITGPDNLTGKDHGYITARWSQSWTKYFKTEANLYNHYLSRVRQNPSVVGSPFVDYWRPSGQSLALFSKYAVKIGGRDAWVQFNADNLLRARRYINETSFTNLLIYPIETSVVWRVTTGVRF